MIAGWSRRVCVPRSRASRVGFCSVFIALQAAGCGVEDLTVLRLLLPAAMNTPQIVEIQPAIPFAEREGTTLRLDLYRPAVITRPLPFIVAIHGGSWASGSRDHVLEFAYDLAAHGYVVAAIDYRLVDRDTIFPAPIADVLAAVRFGRENADKYGIDPDRVATLGVSAGAHLAMMAGMVDDASLFDPEAPPGQSAGISVVVNLFGPTDFTVDPSSVSRDQARRVARFLGRPLDQATELRRIASPITYVRADGPAVLTVHGDADTVVPVSQARSLVNALDEAGQPNRYVEVPGMSHIEGALWMSPAAQSYRASLLDFLNQHL